VADILGRSNGAFTGQQFAKALLQALPNAKPIKVEQTVEFIQKQQELIEAVKWVEESINYNSENEVELLQKILDEIKSMNETRASKVPETTDGALPKGSTSGSSINDPEESFSKALSSVVGKVNKNIPGMASPSGNVGRKVPVSNMGGNINESISQSTVSGTNVDNINESLIDAFSRTPPIVVVVDGGGSGGGGGGKPGLGADDGGDFVKYLGMGNIASMIAATLGYGLAEVLETFVSNTGVKLGGMFDGIVREEFEFVTQMKKTVNVARQYGSELEKMNEDYIKVGKVVDEIGFSRSEYIIAWTKEAKKGLSFEMKAGKMQQRTVKDQQRLIKNSLSLAYQLDMKAEDTSEMFSVWQRKLNMSNTELFSLGNTLKDVARTTGLTGENLTDVAKSAEKMSEALKKGANLSHDTMASMIRSAALAKQFGIEELSAEFDAGISSFKNWSEMTNNGLKGFIARAMAATGQMHLLHSGLAASEDFRPDVAKAGMAEIGRGAAIMGLDPKDLANMTGQVDELRFEMRRAMQEGNDALAGDLSARIISIENLSQQLFGASLDDVQKMYLKMEEEAKTYGMRLGDLNEQLKSAKTDAQKEVLKNDIGELQRSINSSLIATFQQTSNMTGKTLEDALLNVKTRMIDEGLMGVNDPIGIETIRNAVLENISSLDVKANTLGKDFSSLLDTSGFASPEALADAMVSADADTRQRAQTALESISNSVGAEGAREGNAVEEINAAVKSINETLRGLSGAFIFTLSAGGLAAIIAGAVALKTGFSVLGAVQTFRGLKNLFGGKAGGGDLAQKAARRADAKTIGRAKTYTREAVSKGKDVFARGKDYGDEVAKVSKSGWNTFYKVYQKSLGQGSNRATAILKGMSKGLQSITTGNLNRFVRITDIGFKKFAQTFTQSFSKFDLVGKSFFGKLDIISKGILSIFNAIGKGLVSSLDFWTKGGFTNFVKIAKEGFSLFSKSYTQALAQGASKLDAIGKGIVSSLNFWTKDGFKNLVTSAKNGFANFVKLAKDGWRAFPKGYNRALAQGAGKVGAAQRGASGALNAVTKGGFSKAFSSSAFGKGYNRALAQGTGKVGAVQRGASGALNAVTKGGFSKAASSGASVGAAKTASVLTKALAPLSLLIGGVTGLLEAKEAGRTKVEGAVLGALTGGANTGSMFSGMLGIEKGSGGDKALGVAGSAAWGASAGAAIGSVFFGVGAVPGALIGSIVGAGFEILKVITEGTTLLGDIFSAIISPITLFTDIIWSAVSGIGNILKGIVTLDVGTIFKGVFDILLAIPKALFNMVGSIIMGILAIPRIIWEAIKMVGSGIMTFIASIGDALMSAFIDFPVWLVSSIMNGMRSLLIDLPNYIVGTINSAFDSLMAISWLQPIINPFKEIWEIIRGIIISIVHPFQEAWVVIANALNPLLDLWANLRESIFGITDPTSQASGFLSGLASVIGFFITTALTPLKFGLQAFAFVVSAIMSVVGPVVQALSGFVVLVIEGFKSILDGTTSFVNAIITPFQWVYETIGGMVSAIVDVIVSPFQWLHQVISDIASAIGDVIGGIASYFGFGGTEEPVKTNEISYSKEAFNVGMSSTVSYTPPENLTQPVFQQPASLEEQFEIGKTLGRTCDTLVEQQKSFNQPTMEQFVSVEQGAASFEYSKEMFNSKETLSAGNVSVDIGNDLIKVFTDIANTISGVFSSVVETIGSILGTVGSIILAPMEIVGLAISNIGGMIGGIINNIGGIISSVGSIFLAPIQMIVDVITGAAGIVGGVIGSVIETIGSILGTVGSIILAPIQILGTAIGGVIDVISGIGNIVGGVAGAVGGGIASFFGFGESKEETLKVESSYIERGAFESNYSKEAFSVGMNTVIPPTQNVPLNTSNLNTNNVLADTAVQPASLEEQFAIGKTLGRTCDTLVEQQKSFNQPTTTLVEYSKELTESNYIGRGVFDSNYSQEALSVSGSSSGANFSVFDDIGNNLIKIFSDIGSTISDIAGTIGGVVKNIFGTIESILGTVGSILLAPIKMIGNVISGVVGMFSSIVNNIGSIISSVGSILLSPIKMIGNVISGAAGIIGKVIGSIVDTIGSIFGTVGSIITAPMEIVGTAISGVGNIVGGVAGAVGGGIASFFGFGETKEETLKVESSYIERGAFESNYSKEAFNVGMNTVIPPTNNITTTPSLINQSNTPVVQQPASLEEQFAIGKTLGRTCDILVDQQKSFNQPTMEVISIEQGSVDQSAASFEYSKELIKSSYIGRGAFDSNYSQEALSVSESGVDISGNIVGVLLAPIETLASVMIGVSDVIGSVVDVIENVLGTFGSIITAPVELVGAAIGGVGNVISGVTGGISSFFSFGESKEEKLKVESSYIGRGAFESNYSQEALIVGMNDVISPNTMNTNNVLGNTSVVQQSSSLEDQFAIGKTLGKTCDTLIDQQKSFNQGTSLDQVTPIEQNSIGQNTVSFEYSKELIESSYIGRGAFDSNYSQEALSVSESGLDISGIIGGIVGVLLAPIETLASVMIRVSDVISSVVDVIENVLGTFGSIITAPMELVGTAIGGVGNIISGATGGIASFFGFGDNKEEVLKTDSSYIGMGAFESSYSKEAFSLGMSGVTTAIQDKLIPTSPNLVESLNKESVASNYVERGAFETKSVLNSDIFKTSNSVIGDVVGTMQKSVAPLGLSEMVEGAFSGFGSQLLSTSSLIKDGTLKSDSSYIGTGAFESNSFKEAFSYGMSNISQDSFKSLEAEKVSSSMINTGAFGERSVQEVRDYDNLQAKMASVSSMDYNSIFESMRSENSAKSTRSLYINDNGTDEEIDDSTLASNGSGNIDLELLKSFNSITTNRNVTAGAGMFTPEDAADYVMQQMAGTVPTTAASVAGMEHLTQLAEERNSTLAQILAEMKIANSRNASGSSVNAFFGASENERSNEGKLPTTRYKKQILRGNYTDMAAIAANHQDSLSTLPR
jgi:phage-related protein